MSDLARALAFAFRRKGAESMGGAELRLLLAYDLRWFAPEDAKRAVQRAVDIGLLLQEGEHVRPAFDLAAVAVPLNFRPTTAVLDEEAPSLPAARARPPPPLAPPAPVAPARSEHEAAAEDERRRRGLLLGIDAARLVVRRRAGEDVTAEAAALEAQLLSEGGRARHAAP